MTQPRIKKLVVEKDNPLVSPLFNREARKKLMGMTPERPFDSSKDTASALLETPSTPYTTKSVKLQPIPLDYGDTDSHVTDSPLSSPSTPPSRTFSHRPTPQKVLAPYSNYADAYYESRDPRDSVNQNVAVPRCTRSGVETIPSYSSLLKMTEAELMAVNNFTVKREDVGSVKFLTPVDVRGLDIDSIIEFSKHSIVVYPDEGKPKPEPGRELNTRALITLKNCWPHDSATNRPLKDDASISRFVKRLKSMQIPPYC